MTRARLIAAAVVLATLPAQACLADLKAVRTELAHLHTVTGLSALDRMQACGIRIEAPYSSVSAQWLDVLVSLPAPPGSPSRLTDITLRWARKGGSWVPDSGWAERLSTDQGRLDWMPC